MKPYSPKPKGSTKGILAAQRTKITRKRCLRRDKKAARREGTKLIGGANSGKIGSWDGGCQHPKGCIHDWAHGM